MDLCLYGNAYIHKPTGKRINPQLISKSPSRDGYNSDTAYGAFIPSRDIEHITNGTENVTIKHSPVALSKGVLENGVGMYAYERELWQRMNATRSQSG